MNMYSIFIVDAKTTAGIRTVPIHPNLKSLFKRNLKNNKDGYVVSNLITNKNGDRSNALGHRYSRMKTELGFGERHTFHSWRGTVITMLEHAGAQRGPSKTSWSMNGPRSLAVHIAENRCLT